MKYAASIRGDDYFILPYKLNDIISGRSDFDPLLAALKYTAAPADVLSRLLFCARWCRG